MFIFNAGCESIFNLASYQLSVSRQRCLVTVRGSIYLQGASTEPSTEVDGESRLPIPAKSSPLATLSERLSENDWEIEDDMKTKRSKELIFNARAPGAP